MSCLSNVKFIDFFKFEKSWTYFAFPFLKTLKKFGGI